MYKKLSRHGILIAFIGILIFGLLLRLYALGAPNMWIDETISSMAARGIIEHGRPILDSGLGYYRAVVFHYIMAFFLLLGKGDAGARIVSVLFGMGSILLAYLIGREYRISTGLIAALFTAVLSLEIVFSRQARFYQMFQFLFFLTLFFLYKANKYKGDKGDKKYAWFACVSFVFLVETHLAGLVLAPFMFYMAYERKDWKLSVIPLIVSGYFGRSIFNLSYGGKELAGRYVTEYASVVFDRIRAFFFISLLGLPLAWKWNKRMTLLLIVPSLLLLFSLIFLKVFALRYAYFIIPLVIFGMALIFTFILKQSKIMFAFVLILALVYPSNLFFDNPLTIIRPEVVNIASSSEPVLDYKGLNENAVFAINDNMVVALWTPGLAWYIKKPEYFIPFSLDGTSNGYAIYDGKDAYTGALEFNVSNYDEFVNDNGNFVYVEDSFGYGKLNEGEKEGVDRMRGDCVLIDKTGSVGVYEC